MCWSSVVFSISEACLLSWSVLYIFKSAECDLPWAHYHNYTGSEYQQVALLFLTLRNWLILRISYINVTDVTVPYYQPVCENMIRIKDEKWENPQLKSC
jgi:hypothetical protein